MIKQVIVARKDLNCRRGKWMAQAAHASMGVLLQYSDLQVDYKQRDQNLRMIASTLVGLAFALLAVLLHPIFLLTGAIFVGLIWRLPSGSIQPTWKPFPPAMLEWLQGRFTKICVSVDSEAELHEIYGKAQEAGIPCYLIQDCGATEFGGVPTYTCCAIGPDQEEVINPITGHLKLL